MERAKAKSFSERMGFTKPPTIQLNNISTPLRNSLWNVVLTCLQSLFTTEEKLARLCSKLAIRFFKIPSDDVLESVTTSNYMEVFIEGEKVKDWIKKRFYSLTWYEAYDFIEFFVQICIEEDSSTSEYLQDTFNDILGRECSGYRFVNNQLCPITNEQEIQAIEEAIGKVEQFGKGANEHLSQAVALFSKKPDPDYRNSVKESISAVESLVKQISGKDGDFAPALEELSKKIPLHGAMKEGFKKLYGYTSDEDGIRHAILENPNVGLDEAKFMLVACSAFVNFLLSKAQKAGLLKEG